MFKLDFEFSKEEFLEEMKNCYDILEKEKGKHGDNYDYFVNQMLYLFPKDLNTSKEEMKKYRGGVNEEVKNFDKECSKDGLHSSKNKLAYIASPVKVYFERFSDDKEIANEHAYLKALQNMREFKMIYRNNYIPISAPLLFLKVYDENTEREKAFHAGLEILKKCDVFAYKAEDYIVSKGIRDEYKIAKELSLEIVSF